ncbi:hypothetical protein ONZ45_g8632 [Pleurotus djamor]|nr:hypothetical protein ONZ45_g8632 [Pleurotus djamor]
MTGRHTTALNNYIAQNSPSTSLGYADSKTGPANGPTWTVTCKLNNEVRGIGTHLSKAAAKDQASQQALEQLVVEAERSLKCFVMVLDYIGVDMPVITYRFLGYNYQTWLLMIRGVVSGIYIFQPLLSAEKQRRQSGLTTDEPHRNEQAAPSANTSPVGGSPPTTPKAP